MTNKPTANTFPFLAGGGELGELTRQYDWQATALGPPDGWPPSLRATVSILLKAKFPMFLWWGPELIQFYNDAYRPSLGHTGKHPTALGQKGAECWPEIWPLVKPLIDQVLGGGEAVWDEDQLMPIYRNGKLEDVYWTFGYSPVNDDEGHIAGVLVICTETTEAVRGRQNLEVNEARFRRILEQAPLAVALFSGPQFVITLANERVLAFWGRSRQQVMGKPLFEALPEARGQGYEALLQGVYTTGERFVAHELPVTLERNGGLETTYIDFVYDPYYEADGTISGVMVLCVEITQQVLARKAIEESEARFRSIVEQAPMAIGLFKGRDMIIEVGNDRIFEVWDKDPSVIGLPVIEALPEIQGQGYIELLEGVYDTGVPFAGTNLRVQLNRQGQLEDVYFDLLYTPLRSPLGAITGVMVLANEVTEQVRARQKIEQSESRYRTLSAELEQQVHQRTQQLQASVQDLLRSNENLQQFAYVASHDLQEPLRKIQSFGDLLKSGYGDQLGDGADHLHRMQTAASRMSTLIRDLLAYARITTGQQTREAVSLADVLRKTVADLDLVIEETGALVTVDSLPTVRGDPTQLGQLFHNLLSNALKFQRSGTQPQIRISSQLVSVLDLPASRQPSRRAEAYYRVEVADNGIGFDEKYLDRIFQVFQRLTGKSQYAGTGIGLAICEKVVANHGGIITAHSQPGQGATFRVYLPEPFANLVSS